MSDLAGVKPIRAVSGLKGFKPSDLWPLARGKVRHVGEAVAMCAAATRAEAEDIAAQVRDRVRRAAGGGRHDRRARRSRPRSCTRSGATTSFSRRWSTTISTRVRRSAADLRAPAPAHRAPGDVAARRARRAVRVERAARPARDVQRGADAAHQPRRPFRVPRHRPGRDPGDLARCRRRLRLQGDPADRGNLSRLARAASAAVPCAGSRTAASSSRRTPIAASTTTTSRSTRIATGGCSRSIATPRSIPAPIRSTRFPPAWKPRR